MSMWGKEGPGKREEVYKTAVETAVSPMAVREGIPGSRGNCGDTKNLLKEWHRESKETSSLRRLPGWKKEKNGPTYFPLLQEKY